MNKSTVSTDNNPCILLLGGSIFSVPLIEKAHNMGCSVVCCDLDPEAPAQFYADKFHNISVNDTKTILQITKDCNACGILSFACDAGVVTASYIAETLNINYSCPYESAKILQDKGLFRQFLIDHNFKSPRAKRYTDVNAPYEDVSYFKWPVIVKPVDSAGSKGVSKVNSVDELAAAIDMALEFSYKKAFMIEEFLIFEGHHSDADILVNNGKIVFSTYSDQLFDAEAKNPYAIAEVVWPSSMDRKYQDNLTSELQRLVDLLHIKTGLLNVETCVDVNGNPYLMEVSPRGGAPRMAEVQSLAFKIDLLEAEIKSALGLPIESFDYEESNQYWCEYCIHLPNNEAILKKVNIAEDVKIKHVKHVCMFKKEGDTIHPYSRVGDSIGDMILCFDNKQEYDDVMSRIKDWCTIELKT